MLELHLQGTVLREDDEMNWLTGKFFDHAPRFCSRHRAVAPTQGGMYVQHGADRQVWWCSKCLERWKEKQNGQTKSV